MKKEKLNIHIDENENGVSIWVNGRWILDASTFKNDLTFSVDVNRLKIYKRNQEYKHHLKFTFTGDKFDKVKQ